VTLERALIAAALETAATTRAVAGQERRINELEKKLKQPERE
jgi:hypothetical protein